jgi:hypothetical protein
MGRIASACSRANDNRANDNRARARRGADDWLAVFDRIAGERTFHIDSEPDPGEHGPDLVLRPPVLGVLDELCSSP